MGEKIGGCTMGAIRMAPRNITTHKNKAIKVFLTTFIYRISQLLFISLGRLWHTSVLFVGDNLDAFMYCFNNGSSFV